MSLFKNRVAIIPARGGSKGLPGKNVRLLGGKPLIAWTIEAALESKAFDLVMVTTEDAGIANTALKYGAEVPFMRPSELASDTAKGTEVVMHALLELKSKGKNFMEFMLLQPTSPFRNSKDIQRALALVTEKKLEFLVSVCEAEHHPFWSYTLNNQGVLVDSSPPEYRDSNRQELPQMYRLNGAIYYAKVETFLKEKTFVNSDTIPYIMPRERSIDIDTELDMRLAECLSKSGF